VPIATTKAAISAARGGPSVSAPSETPMSHPLLDLGVLEPDM
jgi:hypothetical protein